MKPLSYRRCLTAFLLLATAPLLSLQADHVVLPAVADTTLIETAPTNNLGGQLFFNAGTTMSGTRNRGLFRFDFQGVIPPGSTITSARIDLEVVKSPPFDEGPASSTFAIHRVLRDWGEGNKIPPPLRSPGLGLEATLNEASWTHRFSLTTNTWGTPGGQPNVDYDVFSSSDTFVEFVNTYTFPSREETVADVQHWVDHPEQNFGYLLRSRQETTPLTARRFGSHEDPINVPLIRVEFTPFRINQIQMTNGEVEFSFPGLAGNSYAVESRDGLATPWTTLTNIPPLTADTTIQVRDGTGPSLRFYRVRR